MKKSQRKISIVTKIFFVLTFISICFGIICSSLFVITQPTQMGYLVKQPETISDTILHPLKEVGFEQCEDFLLQDSLNKLTQTYYGYYYGWQLGICEFPYTKQEVKLSVERALTDYLDANQITVNDEDLIVDYVMSVTGYNEIFQRLSEEKLDKSTVVFEFLRLIHRIQFWICYVVTFSTLAGLLSYFAYSDKVSPSTLGKAIVYPSIIVLAASGGAILSNLISSDLIRMYFGLRFLVCSFLFLLIGMFYMEINRFSKRNISEDEEASFF